MRATALLLLLAASSAQAIVIRDDVADAQYLIPAADFPALVDLPMEAHGVLIAPQWVVTAAHAVSHALDCVELGGLQRAVRRVVIHPGYRQPPQAMVEAALASGDWAEFFAFQSGTDDIALIELAEPVQDIAPVALFQGSALGETVRILGRGATGTGAEGHRLDASRRNALRQGYNVIDSDEGRWLAYTFDAPPVALPLEASMGSGDSGGPLLIQVDDAWQLAGLAAWKRARVEGTQVRQGKYGESSLGVRLQHYAEWMARTMVSAAP
jgi:secreted trypsin-like serine protease